MCLVNFVFIVIMILEIKSHSMFTPFLNGAMFARNVHLRDEHQNCVCGLAHENLTYLLCQCQTAYSAAIIDSYFELLVPPGAQKYGCCGST